MLVGQALRIYETAALYPFLGDHDPIVRTAAARELQMRGERSTLVYCRSLIQSRLAADREIAAFILGQLGTPKLLFKKQSVSYLGDAIKAEHNKSALATMILSVGRLGTWKDYSIFGGLARDESPTVRGAVALAIGFTGARLIQRPSRPLQVLKKLGNDRSRSVRNDVSLALELLTD